MSSERLALMHTGYLCHEICTTYLCGIVSVTKHHKVIKRSLNVNISLLIPFHENIMAQVCSKGTNLVSAHISSS